MTEETSCPFTPADFARLDESDDSLFYRSPRLVVHIDDQAIATIKELFREVLSPCTSYDSPLSLRRPEEKPATPGRKPVILDLMSSWRSHWPSSLPEYGTARPDYQAPGVDKKMIGLGLNAVEMAENPDLDEYVVHDVNKDPRIPFDDNTFDGVAITVSVQYLTRPVEAFKDVNRILRAGGVFLVIFSNRMFFTKAVRIWRTSDDMQRMSLVASYFQYAGGYEDIRGTCLNPRRGPFDDPVYVVMARKPAYLLGTEVESNR